MRQNPCSSDIRLNGLVEPTCTARPTNPSSAGSMDAGQLVLALIDGYVPVLGPVAASFSAVLLAGLDHSAFGMGAKQNLQQSVRVCWI
eukprot:CAMPEP_0184304050 /NCGR_PEP_ID=MMETSP1049-20130417/13676_1 /TAXON_ID=77928 /ORGANISM="Proteomonas sulcata, Strain CCMP704" /LENGTH=87 /DNA_ID=CAMNT_0026615777 /DNA_START=171 /DNA_END=434 /DNA_ORIENTATION=-